MWGQPEVYDSEKAARDGIGGRSGVISFFRIAECARTCFFGCWEIWFWPLR
jgi:hypothetical protein